MRVLKCCVAVMLLAVPLAGCWDLKDVQEVTYATALGFDYKDGQFIMYAQVLDFSSVAKTELSRQASSPVWVGVGKGKSIAAAFKELYRTSQMQLFLGHVSSLVLGENLMKDREAMKRVYEFKSRNYEIRSTPWMYGTREPIDRLFSLMSLFQQPPVMSILHQPREMFKQSGVVKPISIREFDIRIMEVAKTALLPNLSIAEDVWLHGEKYQPVPQIDGAFAMDRRGLKVWLSNEDLTGLPWIDPETYNTLLQMEVGEQEAIALQLGKPDVRVEPRVRNGKAEYSVFVNLQANIFIDTTYVPEDGIERKAAEKVRSEIENLFKLSVKHNIDLLGLEESLYRKRNRDWKMLKERDALQLTEDSLKEINVQVKLVRSGKIKERRMMEHK